MSRVTSFAVAACLTGLALNPLQAADPAKTIAPYLDEGAIAVMRADLTKVDVAAAWKFLGKYIPARPQDVAQMQTQQAALLSALKTEKVSEIYVVFSLSDVPGPGPFAIVPVGAGGSHGKVARIMFSGRPDGPASSFDTKRRRQPGPFQHCEQLGNVVFCGTPEVLKRLKSLKPVKRPQLAAAFKSVDGAAVQVVLAPSKDHHRVLSELVPRLPKALGGMDGADLARATQWAALGVNLPPKPKAKLIVNAASNASAKQLKATFLAMARTWKNVPEIKRTIPDIDKIVALLTPTVDATRLTMTFDASSKQGQRIVALLGTAVGQARGAAQKASSRNNLKQLGIAMHNFHETFAGFPPHASYNKKGKRLLSWRVYLLPYVEQQELFKQFHLDEPWDSPHNKKLIAKIPPVLADPAKKVKPGMTRYVAPIGPRGIFDGKPVGIRIRDIVDGTSNTIMLVEAAPEKAVIWTKPDDITIDDKDLLKGLISKGANGFEAGFADGSVRMIKKTIKPKKLKAYFTRNGGEVIND